MTRTSKLVLQDLGDSFHEKDETRHVVLDLCTAEVSLPASQPSVSLSFWFHHDCYVRFIDDCVLVLAVAVASCWIE